MTEPSPHPTFAAALPARADVVIIGGGVAGVGAALALAETGVSVLLMRKGARRGRAIVAQLGLGAPAGPRPARIAADDRKHGVCGGATRALETDIGFRQTGCTYLCTTEAEAAEREAWLSPCIGP